MQFSLVSSTILDEVQLPEKNFFFTQPSFSAWEESSKKVSWFWPLQAFYMNISSELVHLPRLTLSVFLANLARFVNPAFFNILPIH